MYSLNEKSSTRPSAPMKPIVAAKKRRQLFPFFFHMGPVALCITSVLLIGLMAIFYLSQLGQAVAANQEIQNIHTQENQLKRQDQDLMQTLAQEQSPAYIATAAQKLGLVPADPQTVKLLVVPHLQPFSNNEQNFQP